MNSFTQETNTSFSNRLTYTNPTTLYYAETWQDNIKKSSISYLHPFILYKLSMPADF